MALTSICFILGLVISFFMRVCVDKYTKIVPKLFLERAKQRKIRSAVVTGPQKVQSQRRQVKILKSETNGENRTLGILKAWREFLTAWKIEMT